MLPLYPDISPEIIVIAIGSGAPRTIVTDSLFWLVKYYQALTLNETFKVIIRYDIYRFSRRSGGHILAVIYHLAQRDVYYGKR